MFRGRLPATSTAQWGENDLGSLTPASSPLATVAVGQEGADCPSGLPRNHLTAALSKRHPASRRFDRSRSIGTRFTFPGMRTITTTTSSQTDDSSSTNAVRLPNPTSSDMPVDSAHRQRIGNPTLSDQAIASPRSILGYD